MIWSVAGIVSVLESKVHPVVGAGAEGLPCLIRPDQSKLQIRESSAHQKNNLTANKALSVMMRMIATWR